jgi:hypothetical protein
MASARDASASDANNLRIDPDNDFLWRRPSLRMEGEIVRDNLLHLAGRLDRTFGGPDISHQQDQTSPRRSIYLRHAHEKLVEFVQIFDGPAVSECYQRECSVQPHQALALANSPLSVVAAQEISKQLDAQTISDSSFIEQAFLKVLSRRPTPQESDTCHRFLADGPGTKKNLVLVLINHNDFVTIR